MLAELNFHTENWDLLDSDMQDSLTDTNERINQAIIREDTLNEYESTNVLGGQQL